MGTGIQTIPVIRAKLHRPAVVKDFVRREALQRRLAETVHRPLILVSAPAGYGKSTCISHWLETGDYPTAWLTLDEADDDFMTFLSYVVAAVQAVFPGACRETSAQLEASALAPLPILTRCLSNDLEVLTEPVVLVLDDYHHVNEPAVHDLVNRLLKHPPSRLRLVIISRYDPPLSLGALRAHDHVTEIRMRDLMFNRSQTGAFIELATGKKISETALKQLFRSTEGWAAGLRLLVLAIRHRSDMETYLRGFDSNVRQIQDYLVEEVLSYQLPATVECLCRTSILKRFCAPLCEVVCAGSGSGEAAHLDGSTFITLLEDSGLFSVALDESGEWYRYHHLFQEILQRHLNTRQTPAEIAVLHRRAARWFEEHDLLEEAIHHTLHADGAAMAGRLIVRHSNAILNLELWRRLDRWLQQLPANTIETDPELMMLQAWRFQNQGRYPEAFSTLDRIEELPRHDLSGPCTERLSGAVNALRACQSYSAGDGELAMQHAEEALRRLPPECLSERAYALIYKGGAMQMCGDLAGARTFIGKLLAATSLPLGTYQARLETTFCFMDWVAADLPSLRQAASRYRQLGETIGLEESVKVASYFFGIIDYHQDKLAEAEDALVSVVSARRVPNLEYYTESAFALASVYQAGGQSEKASETATSVCEHLLGVGNSWLLQRARAFEADLAMRQGRIAEALEWAQGFDPKPFEANPRFFEPRLTLARVLMAEGDETSLKRATHLVQSLEAFFTRIHNTRFLIEVLALNALLHDAQGEQTAAQELLTRAVRLAQPGGFIRLFVDLGPALARLLNGLDLKTAELRYVGRILAAFGKDATSSTTGVPVPTLTKRELDVLRLLADEMSNKAISDQLCISAATVKRHSENIYQKLGVHGRQQAVSKAKGLSIIRAD